MRRRSGRRPARLDPPADGATGFHCSVCGGWHRELPQAFHIAGPDAWSRKLWRVKGCELSSDMCVIRDEEFFVRGLVRVPVAGLDEPFQWGLWVSVARDDLVQMAEAWETPGRESMPAAQGQLANNLPVFDEPTLGLHVLVHTQPVGERPHIELVEDGHPLTAEQRNGTSHEAFVARVARLLHAS
ncbi:hypothetical protein SAMN05444351_1522 [Geodermatophilus nigrescens]|uniref:DUF2199 domain-containing protein n=1 Tax=Geodermatophilus nigrescens TaxID=1070870 RepID=A0A1M5G2Y4_9ACTN|nr:hypothetical protein SAMN05444351_1522 [Geodermatophilus nigrescens]